ncbi:hypothetical protein EYC84_009824 [Monilinia fructicola]|uniref:DASH complex subunit DAD3 n=1 Tax=Monilinia fructicola TaxID=38448 RepID=A0A5M9J9B0_MONFR|nr:hypothetical protein EYC84_009824 [Monilinia fructicola]
MTVLQQIAPLPPEVFSRICRIYPQSIRYVNYTKILIRTPELKQTTIAIAIATMETDASNIPLPTNEDLSPTEQDLLDEYERLAENMKTLAHTLETMSNNPTAFILDNLRQLERKTSLVFTLLKASVYSIVLQQQISEEPRGGREEGSEEGEGEEEGRYG